MNTLLSFTGGKPDFNIDDMLWNEEATRAGLNDVFRAFGDNYIIYGVTGTTSITAGYVMLDGEMLKVDAHTKSSTHFAKVITYDAGGDATFNDGVARKTWQKNRATISTGSGNLAYATATRLSDMLIPGETIDIGDWNMDTTSSINVAHGVTDYKKIRIVGVTIRNDADTANYELLRFSGTKNEGGVEEINATNIVLGRLSAGFFDSTDFDSTSYNRGYIRIMIDN